ncbi:GGDEF domain-containing protein [Shewanella canadensis]|uniref:diguanylate cyclase n=1 Tax=Shewanella canadensis TaxID=271096 RepID=A0A431WUN1_9GAMM|nr:GGDEF domain-containing protein [Shewanella canadensis]RTR39292.1 GGDEF domain-containing protein [Shewanella canadensis]
MPTRYSRQLFVLVFSAILTLVIIQGTTQVDNVMTIESGMEAVRVIICLVLLFLIESTNDQRQIYTPLLFGISALYLGNLLNFLDDIYDLGRPQIALIEDLFETAGLISVLVGVTLWAQHHQNQIKYLLKLSRVDPLTGLLNRRAAVAAIKAYGKEDVQEPDNTSPKEWSFEHEADKPIHCVMILDLDHFKEVNDTLGHDAGDKLLCDISSILQQQSQNDCIIARWGGEEFLLYHRAHSEEACLDLALSLKYQIGHHPFSYEATPIKITVSIGVSTYSAEEFSLFEAIKHADTALYQAKAAGRDYVQIAQ